MKPSKDWRPFSVLSGFLICHLLSAASQASEFARPVTAHLDGASLEQPAAGKAFYPIHFRELKAMENKAEKETEGVKSSNRKDGSKASSDKRASRGIDLPVGSVHDNDSTNAATPINEDEHSSGVHYPPPPVSHNDLTDKENNTGASIADKKDEKGNKTDMADSVPDMGDSDLIDDHNKDNNTFPETITQEAPSECGGNYCEDPKKLISACLSTPGDKAYKLSLFIKYEGDPNVLVKVIAPKFLKAEPVEVLMSKGKSETIHFLVDLNYKMDSVALQNKTIVVTSVHGDCDIQVPTEYLHEENSHILPSVDLRVIAYIVAFVLATSCAGAWLCYKCHGKKQAGEVKYQHLEMNGLGQTEPKDRKEQAGSSWDEVWDDDWEDAEAAKSSSRLGQSLSSRGMAAKRSTKDGWDSSWQD